MKQALIILGRYPSSGNVKTRLAKEIGEEDALIFYKNCAENIFNEVDKLPEEIKKFFLYPKNSDKKLIKEWINAKYELILPETENLNKNLMQSFKLLFSKGFIKIICIATDIPDLTNRIIFNAFNDLNKNDIVIGPDNDGGIYLFGQNKYYPKIFLVSKNNPVFDSVINNAQRLNLKIKTLEKLIDVDTKNDLENWKNTLKNE